MKSIKFVIISGVLLVASSAFGKVLVDRMLLKNLDGHKSDVTHLTLPAGHTTITVETDDKNAVISCQFINSNGIVGLEQNEVGNCVGNVSYNEDDTMTVKVTNETDSYLDFRVHQVTTEK